MQIKILKFLSIITIAFITTNVHADLLYKFSLSEDAQKVKAKDIKENPDFGKSGFVTGICDGKTVSGAKTHCVKLFSDVQVQNISQAIQIAKDYAKEKNNDDIVCYEKYYGCGLLGCDDHIYCSTVPSKKTYYEIVFDDIVDRTDKDFKRGIAGAYCKMFFGDQSTLEKKEERDYNADKMKTVAENDKILCSPSMDYPRSDIYDTCVKMGNTMEKTMGYYTIPSNYNCTVDFRTIQCSYDYIDNTFKSLQLNLDYGMIAWLGAYVQKQTGKTEFKCDLAPHTCNTDDYLTNPHDDVLTCYADGERMDFRFDDLSETKNKWIKASEDAKECINADGIYDGRRCQGIDHTTCDKLKEDKGIEIDWDNKLNACVLKSANTVANINRTAEIAAATGITTGVAVATVVTGGSTVMVLLAVGATASAAGSQVIKSVEQDKVAKFTSDLLACKPRPKRRGAERNCVRDKMIWFIDHGSNYINNLTSEQIDAVDKALAEKLGALDMDAKDDEDLLAAFEKSKDKDIWERCTGDMLQAGKCIFDSASILLDFLPVTRLALKAPEALATFATKIGKKLPNTAKTLLKMRTSAQVAKKAVKVADKVDTVNDFYSSEPVSGTLDLLY